MGDNLPSSDKVDVFYDTKDVKQAHRVIGHLSLDSRYTADKAVKPVLIKKAKSVGADAIIIMAGDYSSNKNSYPIYKADAIKYTN